MRRFFVLLLVCLLPLRAWAGDAMAMQMAQSGGMAQHASAPAPAVNAAAHGDCHGEGSQAQPDAHAPADATNTSVDPAGNELPSAGASEATPDCGKCIACDLCHATGVPTSAAVVANLVTHSQQLTVKSISFDSADALTQLKPPIL
jgi:hypothetical protein